MTRHAFSFWRFVAVASTITSLAVLAMATTASAAPIGGCPKPGVHHHKPAAAPLCYCHDETRVSLLPPTVVEVPEDLERTYIGPPAWAYEPEPSSALEPLGADIGYQGPYTGGFTAGTAAMAAPVGAIGIVEMPPSPLAPIPRYPAPRTVPTTRAPEMDATSAPAALTLLFGLLAIVHGRIRK